MGKTWIIRLNGKKIGTFKVGWLSSFAHYSANEIRIHLIEEEGYDSNITVE